VSGTRPVVAHLVTPWLFGTGSWIHTQLTHNEEFHPIVITQRLENPRAFPFEPVFDLSPFALDFHSVTYQVSRLVLGKYPAGPYRPILDREHVRILHAHLGWEGARTAHLARAPRRPFVVSFYGRDAGLLPRRAYWRCLYRRLFRLADRVLAEGSHMGRRLVEIGAPPERVRVVHLGVPVERFDFAERSDPGHGPVVGLIAASFREKKGIEYALEAAARVAARHPRLRLRIIGDGPLRPRIEAGAQARELAGRVTLLGYQPYEAYIEELRQAHFLLAPSVTAKDGDVEGGAPVCLIEAQASGLPCLATTHCDIPEVTLPGKSALLAPERDADALSARLDELLSHPERWGEMGRAGRAHVEAEYNIEIQVERMNKVYRELL
jgi:colanic acid/amylovoran biosynthesis glycosyltransferase